MGQVRACLLPACLPAGLSVPGCCPLASPRPRLPASPPASHTGRSSFQRCRPLPLPSALRQPPLTLTASSLTPTPQGELDGSLEQGEMLPSVNTTRRMEAEGEGYQLLLHNGDISYARWAGTGAVPEPALGCAVRAACRAPGRLRGPAAAPPQPTSAPCLLPLACLRAQGLRDAVGQLLPPAGAPRLSDSVHDHSRQPRARVARQRRQVSASALGPPPPASAPARARPPTGPVPAHPPARLPARPPAFAGTTTATTRAASAAWRMSGC
jgi:hypothetical protein